MRGWGYGNKNRQSGMDGGIKRIKIIIKLPIILNINNTSSAEIKLLKWRIIGRQYLIFATTLSTFLIK